MRALRGRDRRGIVTGSAWTANPSSFGRSCDDLCAPTGRRREDAMVGGVVDVGLGYQHSSWGVSPKVSETNVSSISNRSGGVFPPGSSASR